MADRKNVVPDTKEETMVRSVSFGGTPSGGCSGAVDVKDGKIVRIRPLHYDWHYDWEKVHLWKLQRNGKTLEPTRKSLPGPYSLAYKKRVYSPNRIKYPLIRVDWDPNGERNPQNRGISKYKRISWDEATDIIASEIKRIHKQYGLYGILAMGDGHGENKLLQGPHGVHKWLLNKMGGYTAQMLEMRIAGRGGSMVPGMCGGREFLGTTPRIMRSRMSPKIVRWSWSGAAIRKLLPGASAASSPAAYPISGRKSASNRSIFARS